MITILMQTPPQGVERGVARHLSTETIDDDGDADFLFSKFPAHAFDPRLLRAGVVVVGGGDGGDSGDSGDVNGVGVDGEWVG